MLESLLGAAGNSAPGVSFNVTPNATSFNSGNTIEFTITPDNPIPGFEYGWSVAGTIGAELISGPLSGTVTFTDNQPVVVSVTTLADEFKDTSETLALQMHPNATSTTVLSKSKDVTIVYSSHPTGEHIQVATGVRQWVVPAEVYEVSVVCVGAGQGADGVPRGRGGDGGDLRWRNVIAVVPGESLTIDVGAGGTNSADLMTRQGGSSSIKRGDGVLLSAGGGGSADSSRLSETIGGGDGGRSALGGENGPGGGGGAGGYSGNGGDGGNLLIESQPGQGGAAGGGSYYVTESNGSHHSTPGGGVGLNGQGSNGVAGIRGDANNGGGGGSGGNTGTWVAAGVYGGGARGLSSNSYFGAVNGANGAVRIIWGPGRNWPNTNTQTV